jgi:hypothetical protein
LYPENKKSLKYRAEGITEELIKLYSNSVNSVFHIVVTHGKPALTFSRLHGGIAKELPHCGMSAVVLSPQVFGHNPISI